MPSVINSDNGVISGTSGLKTSGSNDGLLDFQSNGTRIAGITTSAFQVGTNNISAVNSMGFRNRIINGDMRIDQRNAGASVTQTTSSVYPVDRFYVTGTPTTKLTAQRNAGSVTPPTGFTNYLGVTSSSSYSVAAGDFFVVAQAIEGFNIADLGWGTANAVSITLSFWVRSSLTGTFGGALENSAGNRCYPFSFSIPSANTWTQITLNIAGDTTGTWLTDNSAGITIRWGLGVGSTFGSGTAGAWSSTRSFAPTGAVSVVGTNGATFYITGVQLEAGSVATPFERRDYGRELIMCQRYYVATEVIGYVAGATLIYGSAYFPATMRVAPTVTRTGNGSVTSSTSGSLVGTVAAQYLFVYNSNIAAGGTYTLSSEL